MEILETGMGFNVQTTTNNNNNIQRQPSLLTPFFFGTPSAPPAFPPPAVSPPPPGRLKVGRSAAPATAAAVAVEAPALRRAAKPSATGPGSLKEAGGPLSEFVRERIDRIGKGVKAVISKSGAVAQTQGHGRHDLLLYWSAAGMMSGLPSVGQAS